MQIFHSLKDARDYTNGVKNGHVIYLNSVGYRITDAEKVKGLLSLDDAHFVVQANAYIETINFCSNLADCIKSEASLKRGDMIVVTSNGHTERYYVRHAEGINSWRNEKREVAGDHTESFLSDCKDYLTKEKQKSDNHHHAHHHGSRHNSEAAAGAATTSSATNNSGAANSAGSCCGGGASKADDNDPNKGRFFANLFAKITLENCKSFFFGTAARSAITAVGAVALGCVLLRNTAMMQSITSKIPGLGITKN